MKSTSDELIDRVLTGMRDTEVPRGLEGRIAARMAQAGDARAAMGPRLVLLKPRVERRAWFSGAMMASAALAVFLGSAVLVLVAHRPAQTVAHTAPVEAAPIRVSTAPANPTTAAAYSRKRADIAPRAPSDATQLSQATVLDALALAEMLAPSRPAPRMPLTAQERLMLRATRQGQPIEMAELETLRQPALQAAAEAHQRVRLHAYIEGLLGPLAAAQALSPPSPSPDDTPYPPSSR